MGAWTVIDGTPVVDTTVEVEVALASRHCVKGIVVDRNGLAPAETSIATELPAGKSRVSIAVPQKYLVDRDGPFTLKDLAIVAADTETTVARLADAYTIRTKLTK